MAKNILIAFDGTWNKPGKGKEAQENTNVWRLFEAALPTGSKEKDGFHMGEGDLPQPGAGGITRQLKWYDQGVGSHWGEKVRGGIAGYGLGKNIQQGYEFLCRRYEPGDRIFIIGFSRGAYSARSLAGMIRNCGLIHPSRFVCYPVSAEPHELVIRAYNLYRNRSGVDSKRAKNFREEFGVPENSLNVHQEVEIQFVGVWDTVGALGIPLPWRAVEEANQQRHGFHDTQLSHIVRNAYHAVAIDEHRPEFDVCLWTPDQEVASEKDKQEQGTKKEGEQKPGQVLQQVWFAGAHSNVGGGYKERGLADVPLRWMADKAEACGLALDTEKLPEKLEKLEDVYVKERPRDSFKEFGSLLGNIGLNGLLPALRRRKHRKPLASEYGNEDIHYLVNRKCCKDAKYGPPNL